MSKNATSSSVNDSQDETENDAPLSLAQRLLAEFKFFVGFFAFMFVFMTVFWGHYKIPSESMQPTLEVGDHLYVSKYAYGYSRHSIPFGLHKLPLGDERIFFSQPKRGDVVVFRNPKSGIVMIKRLIGLPGDKIKVSGGRIILNDRMIDREPIETFLYREHLGRVVGVDKYSEQWPGEAEKHFIYEQTDDGYLDNTEDFIVPEDMLFMMGDNRDNSVDSRADSGPGFVPFSHLVGRADIMMFSFKRCADEDGLKCPPLRFMKKL